MESPLEVTRSRAWQTLVDLAPRPPLRQLFASDPDRARRHVIEAGDLRIDLSRHRADEIVWGLLVDLAVEMGVEHHRDAQLAGHLVNRTEGRAAAHTALRAPSTASIEVRGQLVVPLVHQVLEHMSIAARRVRDGHWRGATGRRIRTVVNLGIGGSDLGPSMAYEALRPFVRDDLECRYISSVDGADLALGLRGLDPAETLVVVSSKTFTTVETMMNARSARDWLVAGVGEDGVADHVMAVTTNTAAALDFGVRPEAIFEFWDWVGGRFSLGSAIGLSLMIAIGPEAFVEMLSGMRRLDDHFATAPPGANAPMMMGLLGVWYSDVLGAETRAVIPYSHHLRRFPAFLQQLEMESNGKSVRLDGQPVTVATSPVVWGEPGTNGQHAFFQLLHQGTHLVPVDFIGFARPVLLGRPELDVDQHHDMLLANMLAQSAALAYGRTADEVAASGVREDLIPHRTFPGNRPSSVILAPALTPSVLGQLIALYEHVVAVQGIVWGINSFDQWGVELGKELAATIVPVLRGQVPPDTIDPATRQTIAWLRDAR